MKYIIITIFIGLIVSCNSKQESTEQKITEGKQEVPKIYITTTSATKAKGEKEITKKDTLSTITDDYFEVKLSIMSDNVSWEAGREIETPTSRDNFRMVFLRITDAKGEVIYFKGSTEFLNFMSSRGYEMVDQKKNEYSIEYTFKKK